MDAPVSVPVAKDQSGRDVVVRVPLDRKTIPSFVAEVTHDFQRRPDEKWRPKLVVQDPGSFAMPVGPVYEDGLGEPIHFLLETVGEDVIREVPRLFYEYRAVEKIAEGREISGVLLLAERFSAKSAFAYSLAFCQAIENAADIDVPSRARRLRAVLAELRQRGSRVLEGRSGCHRHLAATAHALQQNSPGPAMPSLHHNVGNGNHPAIGAGPSMSRYRYFIDGLF